MSGGKVEPRWFVVVNGAAGGGRCRSLADGVLEELRDQDFELEVKLTEGKGHATELAEEAWLAGFRRFLALGGDGTTFEILNGVLPRAGSERPVIGMLPLGTGNSFLREFGVTSTTAAFDVLRRGRTRRVDVGRVEHAGGVLFFLNVVGFGFAARAGAQANDRFKRLGGAAGYVASVVIELGRLVVSEDPCRLDGGEEDRRPSLMTCVCNSRYTGGAMMMAPDADPADGLLDVIRVAPMSRFAFASALPRVFAGTHVDLPEVESRRVKTFELLEPRAQEVLIDGEVESLEVHRITVVPGAIDVVG